MIYSLNKKNLFLIFTYIFFPIFSVDFFSQYYFKVGYFNETKKLSKNEKYGFYKSNHARVDTYRTIYGDHNRNKIIKFRTDKFGTIIPSSVPEKKFIKNSILFCGGSTTETSAVEEGKRLPDRFTFYSSIPAINAGKSGKGFSGCIKTIDYFLTNIGKPQKIIISTNHNSLMEYGFNELKKHTRPNIETKYKKIIRDFIPGIYKLRSKLIDKNKIKKFEYLPTYEQNLSLGCCFGSASFNRDSNSVYFDWLSKNNQKKYAEYMQKLIIDFKNRLNNKYMIEKIIIFIEPNSFLNKSTASLKDYRQYLHDVDGNKVNGNQSAKYTYIYDDIYKKRFEANNFRVIEIPLKILKSDHFYDAAHTTPSGADIIGKFLAENFE
ncbi:MAG: hypothetical protein JJ845_001730 [Prochlorococcus marinus CUG1436]|nr:hypothetical protein [Prochlorococcus marinus CUG1436]